MVGLISFFFLVGSIRIDVPVYGETEHAYVDFGGQITPWPPSLSVQVCGFCVMLLLVLKSCFIVV